MVGIGEFSPHNPKLLRNGKAVLGLGEYDEARKILLEQYRKEKQANGKKAKKKTRKREAQPKKIAEPADEEGEERGGKELRREREWEERGEKDEETKVDEKARRERESEKDDDREREKEKEEEEEEESDGETGPLQRDHFKDSTINNNSNNSSDSNNHKTHSQQSHPSPQMAECSQPDPEIVEEVKKWEQEKYKEELDEQIAEKEKLQQEARDAEIREEEERERIFQEQQRKLREEYEREVNSRRFFVWQRRKRAELLKQRLEQLQREAEERKRLRRLEKLKLRSVLSQSGPITGGPSYNDFVGERDRYKTRSVSPSLLSFLSPGAASRLSPKIPSLYRRSSPPMIGLAPPRLNNAETLIIDAPHDIAVKPTLSLVPPIGPPLIPIDLDPNAVPLPPPKLQPNQRSRRLQEIDSSKSYKLIGETNSPYGFERSRRILTQLGQFRKQLHFGNKFNKI